MRQEKDDTPAFLRGVCQKTKLCMFHANNACRRGRWCQFAHGTEELKHTPDLRRTAMCQSWLVSGRCAQADCSYAHGKRELGHARKNLRLSIEGDGGFSKLPSVSTQPDSVPSAVALQSDNRAQPCQWSWHIKDSEHAASALRLYVKNTFISVKLQTQPGRPRRTKSSPPRLVTNMGSVQPWPVVAAAPTSSMPHWEAEQLTVPCNLHGACISPPRPHCLPGGRGPCVNLCHG